MDNINEQRIEILRKDLKVYETEDIQCQFLFQDEDS
jgi:hypothetical protein